ncbi:MAG: 4-hydroxy-tetrahydrodipicolinate synthase [Pseudomonadota bacterium]
MEPGCYTALITPFDQTGEVDQNGLEQLINFQVENGITGILATGTTGESPTLKWEEHEHVIEQVARLAKNKCLRIAGTGSNNTMEAIEALGHAVKDDLDAILMVDPYYNGPSSLEIRREYYEVAAKKFPDMTIIPYIIPGRTGAQMLPQDLAILAKNYKNITCVKEATGNLDNMRLTRKLCGAKFDIFSGDDALVYTMMTEPDIMACGSISVMSNIAPKAFTQMVALLNEGDTQAALKIQTALAPLFDLVVVTTTEECEFGPVSCRARNPLPIKTMMQILGMPAGPCRKPLGKMTPNGIKIVLDTLKKVRAKTPDIFKPVASFFNVDIEQRLNDADLHKKLVYSY